MTITTDTIYAWLSDITDPEIPALNITDLGIVRDIVLSEKQGQPEATIIITPTYSGCPAMDMIAIQIRMVLLSRGIRQITIRHQLSPAWTTDWMTAEGKEKLRTYGIAPPKGKAASLTDLFHEEIVPCPRCGSEDTQLTSGFGSTSCKALYRCYTCKEPFEYFKCH